MAVDFKAWPSIARLNRDMVVTEKIDGTNAAIIIESHGAVNTELADEYCRKGEEDSVGYTVFRHRPAVLQIKELDVAWDGYSEVFEIGTQSRKRLTKPGDDNFGFAAWVNANADALLNALGAGRHFGEWWGSGIQRGYGLQKGDKRFSLFNTSRYADVEFLAHGLHNVGLVPVLYEGPFSQQMIDSVIVELEMIGSAAAPGYTNAEGVVIYHSAADQLFKVTVKDDEKPKSQVLAEAQA